MVDMATPPFAAISSSVSPAVTPRVTLASGAAPDRNEMPPIAALSPPSRSAHGHKSAFVDAVNQFGLHGNPIKKSQLIVSAANRVTSAAIMPLIRHLAKPSLSPSLLPQSLPCLVRTGPAACRHPVGEPQTTGVNGLT
jgi:hypothetical protein